MLAWAILLAAAHQLELGLAVDPAHAATCPTSDAILAEAQRLLAPGPARPGLIATATISGPPWRAEIRINGDHRTLTAESCPALARGIGLILAMRIEALPIPPPAQTATIAAIPTRTSTAPLHPSPPPIEWFVRARILGDAGSLTRATPGFGIEVGLRQTWRSGTFGLGALWPQSRPISDGSAGQSEIGLYWAALRGCIDLSISGAFGLSTCATGELGLLAAATSGIQAPASATTLWIAGGLEVAPAYRLNDRLALALPIGFEVPGIRPSFRVEPFGEIHRPSAVIGRIGLWAEVRFP